MWSFIGHIVSSACVIIIRIWQNFVFNELYLLEYLYEQVIWYFKYYIKHNFLIMMIVKYYVNSCKMILIVVFIPYGMAASRQQGLTWSDAHI